MKGLLTNQAMQERQALRRRLKAQRFALLPIQQQQAGKAIALQLIKHPIFRRAKHIGVYLNAFGEVPTTNIILYCFALKKIVYLPVIRPLDNVLVWQRLSRHAFLQSRFAKHALGMYQPRHYRGKGVRTLDLLLMPLVAINRHGYRLGMGGGYYDRTLKHAHHNPIRIGLAYTFQTAQAFDVAHWDMPLHYALTPDARLAF